MKEIIIMKAITEITFTNDQEGNVATLDAVNGLLDHVVLVDEDEGSRQVFVNNIQQNFPITANFDIKNSLEIINQFNEMEENKVDFILGVNDIANIDFPDIRDTNRPFLPPFPLKFDLLDEQHDQSNIENILSVYNAKKKYLNSFYALDYFTDFALKHDEKAIVLDNINSLNTNTSVQNTKMKFRFICHDDNWYLRSLVSPKAYKTFDNSTVMYIALSKISEFSTKTGIPFQITQAFISDSKMELKFEETEASEIEKGIYLKAGISVENSELGDGAVSFMFNYEVHNNNNNIFTVQHAVLAKINHGHLAETISKELNDINNFMDKRTEIIDLLKEIKWSKKMTKNSRAFKAIYRNIKAIAAQTIPKPITEELLLAIDPEILFKNAVNLIDVMGKMNEVVEQQSREIQKIIEYRLDSLIPKLRD